ncbi:MAG: TIGR00300 family protein [Candidatus Binatia bacterium]|nr:TIGR00300 family protein [Candidatus Binatia bacterium]
MATGESFLLCPPRFYGVEYVINPWMEGNVGRADPQRAAAQWERLRQEVEKRASIELLEPADGLPDMPFVANAGLVLGDVFVPAGFRFPQRQPEQGHFTAWARSRELKIVEPPEGATFEGEGDALFQPGEPLLWAGYGVRSSLHAYPAVGEALDAEIVPLHLIDERFYHLDTCFCPLPGGGVVYYPDAFDRASQDEIRRRVPVGKRIEVRTADALAFACNAVVTDDAYIANGVSDDLRAKLSRQGFEAVECPLGEFMLAGGAAKCLVLRTDRPAAPRVGEIPPSSIRDRVVGLGGHLLDSGLMTRVLDTIDDAGGSFEIEDFRAGLRHDQDSVARVRVVAPSAEGLGGILERLVEMGVRVVDAGDVEQDARLAPAPAAGVAPDDFYASTIFPTDVRVTGAWLRAGEQRMDAVLVVRGQNGSAVVRCGLLRDLAEGDLVVCGVEGVRTHPVRSAAAREDSFAFMTSGVSSERRVELVVERIAWEMQRIRERGGRVVVVGGPVVIHTGGAPYLARLVQRGYVHAILGGNGLAVHDVEVSLFGTSLGVDLERGAGVRGGHRHHLRAINLVRAHGNIAGAVRAGVVRSGIFYECVQNDVPFALAGSIRDDGPLPETLMDLRVAQAEYAKLTRGADMILMLSSMLHSIGVGNMTPAGVRLICVDISPAVVTKLADRGSVESTGIVTDVGLFLTLLDKNLGDAEPTAAPGDPLC